jgi:hypothetical protein
MVNLNGGVGIYLLFEHIGCRIVVGYDKLKKVSKGFWVDKCIKKDCCYQQCTMTFICNGSE